MMNWKFIRFASAAIVLILVAACDSDYTKTVKAELSKDVRQDSILLGVKFGHTREEFYGRCFDLNRQKLVTQGEGFSVKYVIKDSMTQTPPRDITLYFYPKFDSVDIIKGMDMEFFYPAWTLDRSMQSDSLRGHVMKIMKIWYKGNDFMDVKVNDKQVPTKVDANRRIMVHLEDQQRVLVHVQDLLHPDYRHKGVNVNENLERTRK